MRCINGKDSIIVNPLVEWTDADVWDFLNKVVEVPHCELYDPPYNRRRIGCILCPMSSHATKMRDLELYPYVKKKWLEVFEYFIGGVHSYLRKTQEIKQFCEHGGGRNTDLTTPTSSRKWQYNYTPAPNVRRAGKRTLPPPRRENKKREAKMGRSRGKFVCGSPVQLVAYA